MERFDYYIEIDRCLRLSLLIYPKGETFYKINRCVYVPISASNYDAINKIIADITTR